MKDIDRNINSYFYPSANSFNKYNDIREINYKNLSQVYSVTANVIDNIDATQIGITTLEPGEYYYRHTLNTAISEGSCLFSLIQNDYLFPLLSYYIQAPITETNHSIIPYRFIIQNTTTIRITREKPTSENFKINSLIQIFKRVK